MNIVFHILGGPFKPFRPPRNVTRGPQKGPKTAFFGPKWPYLAIGGPSEPQWVEHWLNKVEHGYNPLAWVVKRAKLNSKKGVMWDTLVNTKLIDISVVLHKL